MIHVVAHWLFHLLRIGRCPCCGRWTAFSRPVPVAVGVPPELRALVPRIARCRHGCTSIAAAIARLERRSEVPQGPGFFFSTGFTRGIVLISPYEFS